MLNDKMNDEIKLAGLEAMVPEELEKHLILNSSRVRTCEDARREVVTCVEEKFGFQIRDSKPSDTGLREHSEVGAVNSLSRQSKEKGHPFRVLGVLGAMDTFLTRSQRKQERWQASVRQRQSRQVMLQE